MTPAPDNPNADSPTPKAPFWLAATAVVLMALNLRPGATSIGPVISEVMSGLGQNATWAAILTAMPGLCFAFFGALAVSLALRTGLGWALVLGMSAAAIGLLARATSDGGASFLAWTVLAFAGMAIGNVLVPPFVKRWFPTRVPTIMTVYTVTLSVGATLPSALAVPLAHSLPGGWRASLGLWGVTAASAVIPLALLARREGLGGWRRRPRTGERGVPMWRSRKSVALGVFFGMQSMQAYVQFGWIAQMYRDGGLDQGTAGLMATIIAGFGIPAGLVMPTIVEKVRDMRWIIVGFGVLLVLGYLGVWLFPTRTPWLWSIFLGISGACFPTALALMTARTRDHHVTARLSGFAQSIGYTLAALGPFLVGWLFQLTGGWVVPLLLLIATSVVMIVSGIIAAAPGAVDDELTR